MIRLALIGLCAIGLAHTTPSCSDNSVELHPHEDCTKFYQCSHGQAVEQICPEGLWFNPNTKQCDWPESAGCIQALQEDNEARRGEEAGEVNKEVDNGANNQEESTNEGGANVEETTEEDGNLAEDAEKHCAGDNSHGDLLPHKDCNKFYECSFGHAFVLECPYGLLFSSDSRRCEWAENVDCGNRERPS